MMEEYKCENCRDTGYDGNDRYDPPNKYICEHCNTYFDNKEKNIMDIEKAEAFVIKKVGEETIHLFPSNFSKKEIHQFMIDFSNHQNTKLLQQNKELLERTKNYQYLIRLMLDNNIGRGAIIGKVYLENQFKRNKSAIEKTLKQ